MFRNMFGQLKSVVGYLSLQDANSLRVEPELQIRRRFTVAEINAGASFLLAYPGFKIRITDMAMIAIGGAAGTTTTVDILATQGAAVVKLLAVAIAALTQNTLVRAGAANAVILAGGVSFVANDIGTGITVGKTGGVLDTATHIDICVTFVLEDWT